MKSILALVCFAVLLQFSEMGTATTTAPGFDWSPYNSILQKYISSTDSTQTFWTRHDLKDADGTQTCDKAFGADFTVDEIEACHKEHGEWKRIGCSKTDGSDRKVLLVKCAEKYCSNVADKDHNTVNAVCKN